MQYKIHAILKTISPLHIAAPGAFRLNPETGFVVPETPENERTMSPCTGVQKIRLVDQQFPVPVIAGNNIMGRLRRHAGEKIANAAKAKGSKLSIQAYSSLMCGAATGSPDMRDLTYGEYLKSSAHPYLGLMGGGPRMLPRNAATITAMPITEKTMMLQEDLMHPYAKDHVHSGILTMGWFNRRNDDLMSLNNVALQESVIDNYVEEITKRQAAIIAEKAKGERSKISTYSFSAYEFVIPGVHFNTLFELDCKTESQLGLFLVSLDSFAAKERLGGKSANGLGAFKMKEVMMVDEFGDEEKIFENGRLNMANRLVKQLVQAWEKEALSLDVATIEEMMTLPENFQTKAEKDAARAQKKAAKQTEQ